MNGNWQIRTLYSITLGTEPSAYIFGCFNYMADVGNIKILHIFLTIAAGHKMMQ